MFSPAFVRLSIAKFFYFFYLNVTFDLKVTTDFKDRECSQFMAMRGYRFSFLALCPVHSSDCKKFDNFSALLIPAAE